MVVSRALIIGVLQAATLLAADPFVGTWKLNVGKSRLRQPSNFTNGLTMKIEPAGENALRFVYDRVPAAAQEKGRAVTEETITCDGKERPGQTAGVTDVCERLDQRHFRITARHDGKLVGTEDAKVSDDGNILTQTFKGTRPDGKPVDVLEVFERAVRQ